MKSNQERSNGCLPPKKREILALEQRPVVIAAAAPDVLHTENLAWLASVASERCRSTETNSPRFPVSSPPSSSAVSSFSSSSIVSSSPASASSASLSAVPLTSLPTIYPTALAQQSGAIQYAQLAPNVQFISSALAGPYAGYISSQILPANTGSAHGSAAQRPHLDGYTTALLSQGLKGEQQQQPQQFQIGLSPDLAVSLPSSNHVSSQYIHLDSTPITVSSPSGHLPLQLHPHPTALPHTLTLGPSQLLVQYSDGGSKRHDTGHGKALANGELELGLAKQTAIMKAASGHHLNQQQQVQGYEARHILLPADYGQEVSGLQTSLVLVASPQPTELEAAPNKGGICLGRPMSRNSSFSSPSEALKPSVPHTVIQTSHLADELPASLYSSAQTPIIGYIASTGHQHAVSYHATLPQHLVIPGGQSLLIPVSGAGRPSDLEAPRPISAMTTGAPTTPQLTTAMPHAYLATALAKCELLGSELHPPPPPSPMVQAILPPSSAPATVASPSPTPPAPVNVVGPSSCTSPPPPPPPPPVCSSSPSTSPASLPPFFMRGSIIQLADGELKRVEDLKTEDFIQSAEISSELKIDSSTVERIDCSPTPDAVVIQFAVGELKAQVCVEVLVEYPFFVFGQGWSSCCPDRTTQLFELSCAKLCVGDVCVSLTLRSLRNGSVRNCQGLEVKLRNSQGLEVKLRSGQMVELTEGQGQNVDATNRTTLGPAAVHAAGSNGRLLVKAALVDRAPSCGLGEVYGAGEGAVYEGGLSQTQQGVVSGSREPRQCDQRRTQSADTDKPLVRKRRWSAPERDQTEKAEEEPPMTLPKPSFIPQEVKVSIEGRSSLGS